MFSLYEDAPALIRDSEHSRIDDEIANGTYDPLPELRSRILNDARQYRRTMLTAGLSTGFLSAIGLGVTFSLTGPLSGAIGCGCILFFGVKGFNRYAEAKAAVKDNDFSDFLTDDQLDDLDEFQKSFKPANEPAKQSLEFIKKLCDELLEPEEEEGIKTVNAEVVKEENPGGIKEEKPNQEIDNFWAKGAKESTVQVAGNDVKKVTLREDGFIDKIDKEVDLAVKTRFGEELNELRHVQGEQMIAINEQIDDLKKDMLSAINNVSKSSAETSEFRKPANPSESAETIGVLGVSADSPHAGAEPSADFALPPGEDGLKLNFGVFDPEKTESKDEFTAYKWAVEYEGLSPKGNPVLNRVWGVTSGGSKKCSAARQRRDVFAARLGEFGNYKLYGEE